MSQWSGEHRAFAIEAFLKGGESYVVARRQFCSHYNIRRLRDGPSENLIRKWVINFRATGSAINQPRPGPSRTSRTEETINEVAASVRRNPRLSIRKRAAALNVTKSTVERILKRDLKFHPYKIQIVQEINENDYNLRKSFCQTIIERFRTLNTVFWSDEAHFHLNGYVNKQNCRFWSQVNPRQKHQRPLHSPKVTVWCALSVNGIIGPYFFENATGAAITVSGEAYRQMISNYFIPQLREHPAYSSRTWFQQDGATCHTARATMDQLRELFPQKLISRFGDIAWPPRSPDLTPMDFFLWGYLKSKVYVNTPRNIAELKQNIQQEIRDIEPAMLRRVMQNAMNRFRECVLRNGRHLEDVIFKK